MRWHDDNGTPGCDVWTSDPLGFRRLRVDIAQNGFFEGIGG